MTVSQGTNVLVGEDLDAAWTAVDRVARGDQNRRAPIEGWDGHAADRVVDVLSAAWGAS